MAFVYILQNDKGKFYIGSTQNLDNRLRDHLAGKVRTTKRMLPVKVVFKQPFPDAQARSIELKLKRLKRRDYIEKIIKDGFIKLRL